MSFEKDIVYEAWRCLMRAELCKWTISIPSRETSLRLYIGCVHFVRRRDSIQFKFVKSVSVLHVVGEVTSICETILFIYILCFVAVSEEKHWRLRLAARIERHLFCLKCAFQSNLKNILVSSVREQKMRKYSKWNCICFSDRKRIADEIKFICFEWRVRSPDILGSRYKWRHIVSASVLLNVDVFLFCV